MALDPISYQPPTTRSSKHTCRADTDMLSELPSNVTQHLLECLPLRDAVRMSILSTYWRYQWLLLSKLTLDLEFINSILKKKASSADSSKLSNVINNILLRFKGPIQSFNVSIPAWYPEEADISQWIYCVSGKGVKKFILKDYRDIKPRLSSGLFFCEYMTHLVLHNCSIGSLPRAFRGFMHLTYILFHMRVKSRFTREKEQIETLISSCPRLQILSLGIFEMQSFTIHAPEHQHLVLYGKYSNIRLKGSTKITTLKLNASCLKKNDMSRFLSDLPNIEKLVVSDLFWPKGTRNCERIPKMLTNDLDQLRFLTLTEVPLNCRYVINILVHLLFRTPHLQQLDITGRKCELCTCKFGIFGSDSLKSLKNIKLANISGLNGEFELLKCLLASSPALEVMEVWPISLNEAVTAFEVELYVAKKVMQYPRASSSAEVMFKT